MAKVYLAPHLPTEELERRYKAATDGIERSHLQIIWLLSRGHAAKSVAAVTGYSRTWISEITWRYNDHGVEGLGDRRHTNPGAAPLLDEAKQEHFASGDERTPAGWRGVDRTQGCAVDGRPPRPPRVPPAGCRVSAPPGADTASPAPLQPRTQPV